MPWREQLDSRDTHGMLAWISDHIIKINDQLSHIENRFDNRFTVLDYQIRDINHRLAAGHQRMNQLERKPEAAPKSRIERATAAVKAAKEFGAAVASLKEWVVGALFVTGSASALHYPDPLAGLLTWLIEKLAG